MFELRKESPCFPTSAEHMALPLERQREMLDECIILANKCTMLCGQLAMFHVVFFWCCINTKAYCHSKASQNGTFVSVCVYVVLYCFFLTRTNSILSIVPLSKRRLALPVYCVLMTSVCHYHFVNYLCLLQMC